MKKLVSFFVAVFFAAMAFGQVNLPIDPKTQKISFQKVIPTQGTDEEVHNRIYSNFLNSYYKNAANVLQQTDLKVFKGQHRIQLDNGDPVKSKWPWITYRFTIEIRDGRIRYTLTDFMQKTQSSHPCEEWMNKEDARYMPVWDKFLEQIAAFAEDWGAQLEGKLQPEQVIEEEDW